MRSLSTCDALAQFARVAVDGEIQPNDVTFASEHAGFIRHYTRPPRVEGDRFAEEIKTGDVVIDFPGLSADRIAELDDMRAVT